MVANPIIGKQTHAMLQILPQLKVTDPWTMSITIGQDADN